MKRCARCGGEKSADEFPRDRSRVDGRFPYCKACHVILQRAQRQSWDEHELATRQAAARRKYHRWRAEDPTSGAVIRAEAQIRRYGLTPADYRKLLEAQGGRCAFAHCQRRPDDDRHGRLHVDHCHVTGVVRGLLCFQHNAMLGNAADDPSALADGAAYLASPPAEAVFSSPRRARNRDLPRTEVRRYVGGAAPVVPPDDVAEAVRRRLTSLRRDPTLF